MHKCLFLIQVWPFRFWPYQFVVSRFVHAYLHEFHKTLLLSLVLYKTSSGKVHILSAKTHPNLLELENSSYYACVVKPYKHSLNLGKVLNINLTS